MNARMRLRPHVVPCFAEQRLRLLTASSCPLCTKLEKQIQALLDRSQFVPSPLTHLAFEVVDVEADPELNAKFRNRIPLLIHVSKEGKEIVLPRFSPRMTTDRIGKQLEKFLADC